jgi:hypothetical protein
MDEMIAALPEVSVDITPVDKKSKKVTPKKVFCIEDLPTHLFHLIASYFDSGEEEYNFFDSSTFMQAQIENFPLLQHGLDDAEKKLGYCYPFVRRADFCSRNYKEADVQLFLDKIRHAYGVKVSVYCDDTSPFAFVSTL